MDIQERTFPKFSRLPPELRQRIWRLALPLTSQVYSISCFDPHVIDPQNWLGWKIVSCPRRASAAVLQTCREARGCWPGYHVARQVSAEVVDPFYANKIVDFDSEDEHKRLGSKVVPRPSAAIIVSAFCYSNLDLVIVNPLTWRIDRKEGMSYHVTIAPPVHLGQSRVTGMHNTRFESIRYVAMSMDPYIDRPPPQEPGTSKPLTPTFAFTGVEALFIVKEPPPHGLCTSSLFDLNIHFQDFNRMLGPASTARKHLIDLDAADLVFVETINEAMKEIEISNGVRGSSSPLPSL